jgi:hypothetical protein
MRRRPTWIWFEATSAQRINWKNSLELVKSLVSVSLVQVTTSGPPVAWQISSVNKYFKDAAVRFCPSMDISTVLSLRRASTTRSTNRAIG